MKEETKKLLTSGTEIAAKTIMNLIPVGGQLAVSVYDAIQAGALEKRNIAWKAAIETRLSHCEQTLEQIGNNEIFTSVIIKATEAAMKTAEMGKREYLANAVMNATSTTLDESKVMIFLDMIDRYSVWHLKILEYFQNPRGFVDVMEEVQRCSMGSPLVLLLCHFPELKGDANEQLVDKIIRDLYADGMFSSQSLHTTMSSDGMVASRTTMLGNEFLSFVTNKHIKADS